MNDKEYLKAMGRILQARLPDNHGFILLTFPYGDDPGSRLSYISTAQRSDAIAAMKEFLIKAGAEEDWMKHIK